MKEEKDKIDDILDWLEPKKELTDEELASLMQDGDAMSDFKDMLDVQQAAARHGAEEEGLPVYCILSQKAIEGITKSHPQTQEELLSIKGIGKRTMEKYGDILLKLIAEKA